MVVTSVDVMLLFNAKNCLSILCAVPADLSDSDSLTRFRFLVFTGLIFGAHILSQERVLDL
jgi:hypothetical protein